MNLLYVGHLPPHPGGSAVMAADLLAGLEASGHRVRALAPITREARREDDAFALTHPGLRVRRYLVPHFSTAREPMIPDEDYRSREGAQIASSLRRLVVRERPDAIFIGHEKFAWHVPALARTHGFPCLLLVHGSATLVALTASRPALVGSERFLDGLRTVDLVVAVADHLADALTKLGLTNVRAIPNPVNLEQFVPGPGLEHLRTDLGVRHDDLVVAHVSRFAALKRPLDIVASAALALREDPRLVYLIVGDGPMRDATEAACRQAGLRERFRFVGWVEHARVADYLRLADMVVMPSESEGQSLVYLETQACGRLLLASDIPGAREVIVDGETGLLFRKGDTTDLAAKTLLAARDEGLRKTIGRDARKAVEARRIDAAVAEYEAALGEAIRLRGSRSLAGS